MIPAYMRVRYELAHNITIEVYFVANSIKLIIGWKL